LQATAASAGGVLVATGVGLVGVLGGVGAVEPESSLGTTMTPPASRSWLASPPFVPFDPLPLPGGVESVELLQAAPAATAPRRRGSDQKRERGTFMRSP